MSEAEQQEHEIFAYRIRRAEMYVRDIDTDVERLRSQIQNIEKVIAQIQSVAKHLAEEIDQLGRGGGLHGGKPPPGGGGKGGDAPNGNT